jgi:four helix bundle protein
MDKQNSCHDREWPVVSSQLSEWVLLKQTMSDVSEQLRMKVRRYEELIVWQRAMDLVDRVYEVSKAFPKEEIYGLTSQVRKAVVSIPSNVAEGQGRRTTADFLRHLSIAYGSLLEVETQVLIAQRLHYLGEAQCDKVFVLSSEVGRLLNGLMSSLSRTNG